MATKLSRRRLLQLASAAVTAMLTGCLSESGDEVPTVDPGAVATPVLTAVAGYDDSRKWEGRTLVVATPGDEGSNYLESQVNAIFEPFQRLTGAEVRTVRMELDLLHEQVNTADVEWSVCDVPAEEVLPLANSAIITEVDYGVVDPTELFEPFVMQHGIGANLYATVLAFHQFEESGAPPPGSWADFWDLEAYPGVRGFQESPIGTLEFALLAGGVAPDALYPLDVDLAFRQLNAMSEQIVLWWRQGAQPTQMIAAGDLVMVAAWHDRIQELAASGAPVGLTWNNSQINGDSWVVPNGTPEREMAMDFLNFATRPEVAAAFSRLFPFGPTNRTAYDLLDVPDGVTLPGAPEIIDRQFVVDLDWWFRNREPVEARFQEWLSEQPKDS